MEIVGNREIHSYFTLLQRRTKIRRFQGSVINTNKHSFIIIEPIWVSEKNQSEIVKNNIIEYY